MNKTTLMFIFSIVSLFIPLGTILAIWTLVYSVQSQKLGTDPLVKATFIISIISIILIIVPITLIIVYLSVIA
ncbi:hypothetical protein [Paenilisteria rocourtiae]|uniref:Uncharacterized protein n=1 Tax=Listeria rocourtiae TaxID=647910 RepID=A0A4R6ZFE6_9LIST|nr:hypothetical protein [Listeria rocourtiae]EUJ42885.1 hypothetical protein PROCOU_16373 [Listeria rocourtiae FSL F6-920]MBC1606071.1 hypothetical protein [Listeria rocourtiae]TDR50805.1 hypothetical protein DFP96_11717 [Listeria rocourtiae]